MKCWARVSLAAAIGLSLAACQSTISPEWPFGGGEVPPSDWQSDGHFRQEGSPATEQGAPAQAQAAAQGVATPAPEGTPPGPSPASRPGAAQTVPLLSWDGGVVDGPPSGTVVQNPAPKHGIEPTIEGRMHIIELYQEVLDERDALLREVQDLGSALETTQMRLDETSLRAAELEARVQALEEDHRALMGQNQDMASRLTTAQIRRLEAEKLLLETRIARHREREEAAVNRADGGL